MYTSSVSDVLVDAVSVVLCGCFFCVNFKLQTSNELSLSDCGSRGGGGTDGHVI